MTDALIVRAPVNGASILRVPGPNGAVVVRVPGDPGRNGANGINLPTPGDDYRVAMSLSGAVLWDDLRKVPGLVGADITPEQFGALGGTHDDAQAFRDALAWRRTFGGRLKLTKQKYTLDSVVPFDSGDTVVFDSAGARQTGAGVTCQIVAGPTLTGYLFDAVLYQTFTETGAVGSYTVTGGWNGSATITINITDSASARQTKFRTLPGLGAVTVTAVSGGFRVDADASIGDPSVSPGAVNGALAWSTFVLNTAGVSAGTVTVSRHRVESVGFSGIEFIGGVIGSGSNAVGGIRARLADKVNIHSISGTQCSKGVIVGGGGAWVVENPNVQNFMFAAAPLALGALTLYGADHFVLGGEYAGLGGTTGTALVDATNRTHVALAVHSQTTWVIGVLTELADRGIFNGGKFNKFIGWRADLCGAEGLYEASYVVGNQYTDGTILSCGLSANNTYDGMRLDGSGHRVAGVRGDVATNVATTNKLRYFVNDNDTTTDGLSTQQAKSVLDGISADVNLYAQDIYTSVLARPCFPSDVGYPDARPKAAHMGGRTWEDALTGRTTHSRGGWWRDSLGEVVGNVLASALHAMDTSMPWQAVSGTCTLARQSGHAHFGTPWSGTMTVTSAGVTAGFCEIASTGAGTAPKADPERSYTLGMHVYPPAGRANTRVAAQIVFRDASNATLLTTSVTSYVTAPAITSGRGAFVKVPVPDLAPDGTDNVIVAAYVKWDGMVAGDVCEFDRVTLKAGTDMVNGELP